MMIDVVVYSVGVVWMGCLAALMWDELREL